MYVRSRKLGSLLPVTADDNKYSKFAKTQTKKAFHFWFRIGVFGAAAFLVLFGWWLSTPILKAYRTSRTPDFDSEMYYKTPEGALEPFPSLYDPATRTVSVVVPAYNEEDRMPAALEEMVTHLTQTEEAAASRTTATPFTWEIIIVDDGSKDKTANVALEWVEKYGSDRIRLLKLHRNSGKGAAVRKGFMRARGDYVLMADADGATRASDLARLMEEIKRVEKDGFGVAIGSRAHMSDGGAGGGAKAKRSPLRRITMWGFHTFVSIMIGGSGIKDTQCGFKLFTRESARNIFPILHIERWAFDVELVFLAAKNKMPMVEVPVNWKEMPGSKVDVVSASIQMARDIIVIRLCYVTGIWSDVPPPPPEEPSEAYSLYLAHASRKGEQEAPPRSFDDEPIGIPRIGGTSEEQVQEGAGEQEGEREPAEVPAPPADGEAYQGAERHHGGDDHEGRTVDLHEEDVAAPALDEKRPEEHPPLQPGYVPVADAGEKEVVQEDPHGIPPEAPAFGAAAEPGELNVIDQDQAA